MVYFPGWGRSDWDNLSAVNPRTGRVRPWDQLKRPAGPTGNFRLPSQPKGGTPLGQAISGLLPPISTPTKEPGSPTSGGVPRTYSGGGGIPRFYEPIISPIDQPGQSLPPGVSWPGGNPWFDESTGRPRVPPYAILPIRYPQPPGGGQPQPQPLPQPPGDTWLNPLPEPDPKTDRMLRVLKQIFPYSDFTPEQAVQVFDYYRKQWHGMPTVGMFETLDPRALDPIRNWLYGMIAARMVPGDWFYEAFRKKAPPFPDMPRRDWPWDQLPIDKLPGPPIDIMPPIIPSPPSEKELYPPRTIEEEPEVNLDQYAGLLKELSFKLHKIENLGDFIDISLPSDSEAREAFSKLLGNKEVSELFKEKFPISYRILNGLATKGKYLVSTGVSDAVREELEKGLADPELSNLLKENELFWAFLRFLTWRL